MQLFRGLTSKYKSLPPAVRASFFLILSGAMKDAVDVLTTPIFTRLLTQEEYGLFNVYNSWYQIVRIIVSLYIFGDGFSVGMARYGDDQESFASAQQGLITVLVFVWSIIYLAGKKWVDAWFGLSGTLIVLMLLQTLFITPFNAWQQKEKYRYHYKTLTIVVLIYTILQPLLGIILIRRNHSGLSNALLRIYSGVGVQIAFGLAVFIIQFVRKPVFFRKTYWRFSLKTNIPLAPHYMSQVVLNHSDRLMINAMIGAAQNSIYSVAHAAAFALHMITANVNSTFVPWLYEKLKKNDYEGIRKVTSFLVALSAIAAVMLVLIAPEAMAILGGGKYAEGKWIIPPLTFSVFLIFVYSLFSDVELFYGKNVYVLYSSVAGAAANLLLNYFMIRRYGYFAAGYTTVASYLLMCGGHYYFLLRTCRQENISFSKLFYLPFILVVSVALAAACALIMLLYHTLWLRYGILVAVLFCLIWKRKALFAVYRRLKQGE